MQDAKCSDPTLAVYAAYAYSDLGRRDLIRQMGSYMIAELGARLFDIAMLARELDGAATGRDPAVLGFAPLLSQGWALLDAYRIRLPMSLQGLREMLVPSVWTMFDARAVDPLRAAMTNGEIR
jgi:hypothetical protein